MAPKIIPPPEGSTKKGQRFGHSPRRPQKCYEIRHELHDMNVKEMLSFIKTYCAEARCLDETESEAELLSCNPGGLAESQFLGPGRKNREERVEK